MIHYFYKITNNINQNYYYGIHSTNNINDNYMGSGVLINRAYKKYGIENFTKEIIKYFNSREEAYKYESYIVNEELLNDPKCYNICLGGLGSFNNNLVICKNLLSNEIEFVNKEEFRKNKNILYESINKNKTCVKDKNGNIIQINVNDERFLSGELINPTKDTIPVTINNKIIRISREEYNSGKYDSMFKNKVRIRLDSNTTKYIDKKEFETGKYISDMKGYVIAKNIKTGKNKKIKLDDPEYINGNYVAIQKGFKLYRNIETNEIKYLHKNDELLKTNKWIGYFTNVSMYKDKYGNHIRCSTDDPRVLSGELVGISLGYKMSKETCEKCRKHSTGRIWINNGKENKFITKAELNNYDNNIWKRGKIHKPYVYKNK